MGTNPPIFKFTLRHREIVSFEGYQRGGGMGEVDTNLLFHRL